MWGKNVCLQWLLQVIFWLTALSNESLVLMTRGRVSCMTGLNWVKKRKISSSVELNWFLTCSACSPAVCIVDELSQNLDTPCGRTEHFKPLWHTHVSSCRACKFKIQEARFKHLLLPRAVHPRLDLTSSDLNVSWVKDWAPFKYQLEGLMDDKL